MNTVAILNPIAGRRKRFRVPARAEGLETKAPGHATELAREAIKRGAQRIIAIGGDGTINEVVAARVNRSEKLLGGKIAFLTATLSTAWSFPGKSITLQLDDSKIIQAK